MKNGMDRRYHRVAVFATCLVCMVIYSNTLNAPFVFDDYPNIQDNVHIRLTRVSARGLYDAGFKSPNAKRPLSNISFALNYYWGGYTVSGYHVVNIIIHLINGILVYFLSLILFRQASQVPGRKIPRIRTGSIPLISLFAALIFIAHPIQTQSVTYIVQRMNSLATMFYLLSLLLYIQGRMRRIRWKQWALFCGCFVCWLMALGSKEIAVTLPLVIFLYERYFFQDLRPGGFKQNFLIVFLLFSILGLAVFIYLGKNPFDRIAASYAIREFTLSERVLTQFRVVVFYISLLLYPHPSRLNLLHFVNPSRSLFDPITTLLSLLIIAGLIGFAVCIARKQRFISFCILWFFINLVIESSVIGLEMIFEHRLYLPMLGFVFLVAALIFHCLSQRRPWAIVVSVIILLPLGAAAYVRNTAWQNQITLWTDVVSKNPHSHRAQNNLGNASIILEHCSFLRILPTPTTIWEMSWSGRVASMKPWTII